jgi:hypothetical protein
MAAFLNNKLYATLCFILDKWTNHDTSTKDKILIYPPGKLRTITTQTKISVQTYNLVLGKRLC